MASFPTNPVDIAESGDKDVAWIRSVLQAVRGTRYGSVEVVIHDGRVVQIERREKVRFDEAGRRLSDHRGRDNQNQGRVDRISGGFEKHEEIR